MFQRWFDQPPQRPLPLADTPFPHVALLVDVTTTPCFCPRGRFEDEKVYYDAKNKIYGLKTEVAVTAQPPYFCPRVSVAVLGAIHDFELFKRGFQWYLNYLTKLPAEHAALYGDQMSRYWPFCATKGTSVLKLLPLMFVASAQSGTHGLTMTEP